MTVIDRSNSAAGFFAKKTVVLFVGAAVALLAGCNGDDSTSTQSNPLANLLTGSAQSDSQSSSPTGTAEGVYAGTISGLAGPNFEALILDTGAIWLFYGTNAGGVFNMQGFAQGDGSSSDGTYNASGLKDFGTFPAVAASLSASYNAGASLQGSLTVRGSSHAFSGSSGSSSGMSYTYDKAAALSTIQGNWTARSVSLGANTTFTVAADGALTGKIGTCSYSGTIAPRASGKNVFDLTITYGGAPCPQPGLRASGVALAYALPNGGTQLVYAGVDPTRTAGDAGYATR